MGRPASNISVYEQRLGVPGHLVAESIRGALVTQSRPGARRAPVATRLGGALGPFDLGGLGAPGGWIILVEPELYLAPDILVPDLAGWRRSRVAEPPDVVGVRACA